MDLKRFENDVLNGLGSKDQLDLLDSIDRLRSQGIDHYVSLPQIVVCGDQSSGKSSVLEAISGVSFPVKGSLCTRFPTELILRKTPDVGVSVSIVPHQSHTESERASLRNFGETLDGFDKLPELIEKAKTAMAIGSFGQAFSRDLLRVEVSGPDRPHLTIVDLPGLIHSETKQQSSSDIKLVQDVVKSYMKEPRSIILAVVSAKNDYANQIVLKLARAVDTNGTRTLGVITKPDTLIPGSPSEAMYVSLAQNLDVEFRLGWHVLKNMDSETGSWSLSKRDEKEQKFFSEGIWAGLPESILGITLLRERLSTLLLAQIAAELPSLIDEIELKATDCRTQLDKLGNPRDTIKEQQLYLLSLSQTFQSITKAAVDGTYNDPFFGDANTDDGYQKRIRAVVQNLNQTFAETIARDGHCYSIEDSPSKPRSKSRGSDLKTVTRNTFLDRVEHLMKRTRGRELPGTFNPMIVSDLFFEQSQPWEHLTRSHVAKVTQAVKLFLEHITSHIADASTCASLLQKLVEPAADQIAKVLESKATALLAQHQRGHPITYNHYFTEIVQKVRKERNSAGFTRVIEEFFGIDSLQPAPQNHFVTGFRPLLDALMACNEPEMNRYACSEALDCMLAYYKVALKRFVDDIAVEAIEENIIAKLEDILSPIKVTRLPADTVTDIAGESEESSARRRQLENQLSVLGGGLETCRKFVPGRVQRTRELAVSSSGRHVAPSSVVSLGSACTSSGELMDTEGIEEADTPEVEDQIEEPVYEAKEGYPVEVVAEPQPVLCFPEEAPLATDNWGDNLGIPSKKSKKKGKEPSFGWDE